MLEKTTSGHTRINTSNQPYRENWGERLADSLQAFDVDTDENSFIDDMTKYYLKNCDTGKLISRGFCFDDVYLGYNFEESSRGAGNCYQSPPYPFHVRD